MWSYDKKLQYPVNIKNPNPKFAQIVLDQYGGPDGELGASLRYLSQRYTMPYPELKGLLTDIGTEVPKLPQNQNCISKITYIEIYCFQQTCIVSIAYIVL